MGDGVYLAEMMAAAALMVAACTGFRVADNARTLPGLFGLLPGGVSGLRLLAWGFLLISAIPPIALLGWEHGLPIWFVMLGLLALAVLLFQALSPSFFGMLAGPLAVVSTLIPVLVICGRIVS